jgi:hypothetical protein
MRRILQKALLLAAAPAGVAVGLWMALLTYLPYQSSCGKGLGLRAFCLSEARFTPGLCAVCGAGAAALLVLAALALRRRASG